MPAPLSAASIQQPHGMILEGLVLHLPRPRFHVTVCAMRWEASLTLATGADRLVRLPRTFTGAKRELEQLRRVHIKATWCRAGGHANHLVGVGFAGLLCLWRALRTLEAFD